MPNVDNNNTCSSLRQKKQTATLYQVDYCVLFPLLRLVRQHLSPTSLPTRHGRVSHAQFSHSCSRVCEQCSESTRTFSLCRPRVSLIRRKAYDSSYVPHFVLSKYQSQQALADIWNDHHVTPFVLLTFPTGQPEKVGETSAVEFPLLLKNACTLSCLYLHPASVWSPAS